MEGLIVVDIGVERYNRDRLIGRTILTSNSLASSFGNERWEQEFLEAVEARKEGRKMERGEEWMAESEEESWDERRGMPGPPCARYSPEPGSTTRLAFFVVNNLA